MPYLILEGLLLHVVVLLGREFGPVGALKLLISDVKETLQSVDDAFARFQHRLPLLKQLSETLSAFRSSLRLSIGSTTGVCFAVASFFLAARWTFAVPLRARSADACVATSTKTTTFIMESFFVRAWGYV